MKGFKEAVAGSFFVVFGMLAFGWDSLTTLLRFARCKLHCAAYIWQTYTTPLPPHRPNPDRSPDTDAAAASSEGAGDSGH